MDEIYSQCTKCAKCCLSLTENGHCIIPLSRADLRALRKTKIFRKMRREGSIIIGKGKYDPYYPFELRAEGPCPFLNLELMNCVIYDHRPANCREFTCY